MPLPLSQLVYGRFRERAGDRHVVTLHGYDAFFDSTRELGLAVNPHGNVTGLQASKGVYLGRTVVGYTWFVGPMERPSPVHYGDAMQEIERFLWDEVDRQSGDSAALPFLVGVEQGGIMALAMAGAVPDLLSGVVAIDATFPVVPGWEPPLAPLNGLPILLVNPRRIEPSPTGVLTGTGIAGLLDQWGAEVETIEDERGAVPTGRIAEWLAGRPVRTIARDHQPKS